MRLAVALGFAALSIDRPGGAGPPVARSAGVPQGDAQAPPEGQLGSTQLHVRRDAARGEARQGRADRRRSRSRCSKATPGCPASLAGSGSSPRTANRCLPRSLAEQDRDRAKKANEMARRLETEPDKEQARQERDWQKLRRERDEAVGDIYTVFDVKMTGREQHRRARHDRLLRSRRGQTRSPRPAKAS